MEQNRKEFIKLLGMSSLAGWANLNYTSAHFGDRKAVVKPSRLKKGDTIGMISPASILPDRGRYAEIVNTIEGMGFRVVLGRHAKNRYGDLAGSDAERASDLNAMFQNPEVDAIIPFRGGWGSNRILDLINFDAIRRNPKPLIGFSDITSLLLAIYKKTGLVTFHGPVGRSEWTGFTRTYFRKALMEDEPFIMHNPVGETFTPTMNVFTPGVARGRLLGGNLTVLTSMLGSEYAPDWEGCILFLEDVGEDVYRIDRMLTQLKLNGILDRISGFVFGRCTNCKPGNSYSLSLEQVLSDHIQRLKIPAFYGSMIGHIDHMYTIPIGVEAELNASQGSIKLLEMPTA